MKHHTDHRNTGRETTGTCVIGFDIWGTLLDLDGVLKSIASGIARVTGLNEHLAEEKMYRVHREARNIRRRNPDIKPSEVLEISQKLLVEEFSAPRELLLGVISEVFEKPSPSIVYSDTLPALKALSEKGISMGLIGNVLFWPSSLTRKLLESFNIAKYMRISVFSDEVEVSKPDRKIFLLFAEKMNIPPDRIIYVGDNIVEDVGGALAAGFIGILIDRRSRRRLYVPELRAGVVSSLAELVEVYTEACE